MNKEKKAPYVSPCMQMIEVELEIVIASSNGVPDPTDNETPSVIMNSAEYRTVFSKRYDE